MHIDDLFEQLVMESFDKGYPWSPTRVGRNEEYNIDLPDGNEIIVNFNAVGVYPKPELNFMSTDFNANDLFAMTGSFGKGGVNPIRVFSSIIEIIKKSPIVRANRGFFMEANKSERSRVKLYQRMLTRYNMKYEVIDTQNNGYITFLVTV